MFLLTWFFGRRKQWAIILQNHITSSCLKGRRVGDDGSKEAAGRVTTIRVCVCCRFLRVDGIYDLVSIALFWDVHFLFKYFYLYVRIMIVNIEKLWISFLFSRCCVGKLSQGAIN